MQHRLRSSDAASGTPIGDVLIAVVETNDVLRVAAAGQEKIPVLDHDLLEPQGGTDGL
jgi:hypothetical protein